MSEPMPIYKVLRIAEMAQLDADGIFQGSADDLRDGFVHFSTAAQLAVTLQKYYAGAGEVHLLEVPSAPLGDDLRWEVSRDGAKFPHLYAPLKRAQVSRDWTLQEADGYALPQDLG